MEHRRWNIDGNSTKKERHTRKYPSKM